MTPSRVKKVFTLSFLISGVLSIGPPGGYTSLMPSYVALLRGINVGGKNLIRMPALKACFEANGFEDVVTYIQSGNVLFSAPATPAAELTRRIEAMLAGAFDYVPTVVVRNRKQMRAIVDRAPKGFGSEPTKYRYDVIFLKEPLTARAAIRHVPTNPAVDRGHAGTGVLYFSRLEAKATSSRLNRIVGSPIYPSVTIRNWNTTTKLLSMMESAP
jgi:uncharacterized protein (DUF1697 family)